MFNEQELADFVEGLMAKRGLTNFSDSELVAVKADLLQRLVGQIEIALVDALPEKKADELADILEQRELDDEELASFLRENGVNIEEIVIKTKEQFEHFFLIDIKTVTEGEK